VGQANVQVNCWVDDGYGPVLRLMRTAYYECGGLPVGYTYTLLRIRLREAVISPQNYRECLSAGEYTDKDIIFGEGGLTISGTITDEATTLPLADVSVGCWNVISRYGLRQERMQTGYTDD